MKILHVLPSFGIGGMEKVVCLIINEMSGDYVHEILPLDNEAQSCNWINKDNVRVLSFRKEKSRIAFFRNLYSSINYSNPNILMTYNWGATDAIWLGWLAGIRSIFHNEHGFNIDETHKRNLIRYAVRFVVYRIVNKVVVVSAELKKMMRHSYYLPSSRIAFIPNGIDLSQYSFDGSVRKHTRSILGVLEDEILIGFAGRLDPVKNLTLMLDVFELSLKQNTKFKLLVIGDGSEKLKFEEGCQKKGISAHVLMVGQKDNVIPYLQALDIFLLTSLREQLPMSLLEAMAMQLPIVSTPAGDIPFIIENGRVGFVSGNSSEQTKELVSALVRLGGDKGLRREMGTAAFDIARLNYDKKLMILQYENLLREAV